MSRSRKKPIIKDNGFHKDNYWRTVRRVQKSQLSKIPRNIDVTDLEDDLDVDIPPNKSIVNDYDYCDWINYDDREKAKRK